MRKGKARRNSIVQPMTSRPRPSGPSPSMPSLCAGVSPAPPTSPALFVPSTACRHGNTGPRAPVPPSRRIAYQCRLCANDRRQEARHPIDCQPPPTERTSRAGEADVIHRVTVRGPRDSSSREEEVRITRKFATTVVAGIAVASPLAAGSAVAAGSDPLPMKRSAHSAADVGRFVNANSGKCLEIANSSKSNGARAQQWTCKGQAGAKW